ncbi:MAG: hypothetical protein IH608_11015 [Proteobacteria bacterium]|nr:hypothetical protein [Pseudomonadota bacterium]
MGEPGGQGATVLREVTLRCRPGGCGPGQPEVLVVLVTEHADAGERWFELRGEDLAGRVQFSFRDARRLEVLEEFDRTVGELLVKYSPTEERRVVHG